MNYMLKTRYGNTENYLCVKAHAADVIAKGLRELGIEVKVFRPDELELEDLPDTTKEEVKIA